jgi:hypothetical protein
MNKMSLIALAQQQLRAAHNSRTAAARKPSTVGITIPCVKQ